VLWKGEFANHKLV